MADNADSAYEYFVSFKLTGDNKDYKWDPTVVEKDFTAEKDDIRHSLHLTQVILDAEAVEGDMNLIELQTTSIEGNPMVTPLAFLKAGTMYQTKINVELPNSDVNFILKKGSGPVHVIGLHTVTISTTPEEEGEEEEAEDAENAEEETETVVEASSAKKEVPTEAPQRRMSTRSMDGPVARRKSSVNPSQSKENDEIPRRKSSAKEVAEALQRRMSTASATPVKEKEPEAVMRRKSSGSSRRSVDGPANGDESEAVAASNDKKRKSGTGMDTVEEAAKEGDVKVDVNGASDKDDDEDGSAKKLRIATDEPEVKVEAEAEATAV